MGWIGGTFPTIKGLRGRRRYNDLNLRQIYSLTIILLCTSQYAACWPSLRHNSVCFHWADKTVKLWKISERDRRPEGYNLKDEEGRIRDPATITTLRVSSHREPYYGLSLSLQRLLRLPGI